MKTAALIGNRTALNLGIAADLKDMGYNVFSAWADEDAPDGRRVDPLKADSLIAAANAVGAPVDLLIVSLHRTFDDPKATILDKLDLEALKKAYEYNTLGAIRAINVFLPLLEQGEGKRIAVITNRESSNSATREACGFGDHMAHAPLNMAMSELFNGLRPKGYTFRMYVRDARDDYDPFAAEYITRGRSVDLGSPKHTDENRFVLRDSMNIEIPW